jgi:uridine phosphorylase
MEYRLNKIDTDLRQKINDATKEGKVHGTKGIAVSKDKPHEQKEKGNYNLERYKSNKKLTVEAEKVENIEIEAFKDKDDLKNIKKGTLIDTKI